MAMSATTTILMMVVATFMVMIVSATAFAVTTMTTTTTCQMLHQMIDFILSRLTILEHFALEVKCSPARG